MKSYRAVVVCIVMLVSLLFVVGCSQVPASMSTPTVRLTAIPTRESTPAYIPKPTFAPTITSAPTVSATPPISAIKSPPGKMGVLLQKSYTIADKVTQDAQGLLVVTYAEIPDHGQGRFGVHYNFFIIKRADLLTPSDIERVGEFVAETFKLTTQEIIVNEPSITHMGVMVVTPDFWFFGGFKRGPILVFEAPRAQLLALGTNATSEDWLVAAQVSRFDSDDFQP